MGSTMIIAMWLVLFAILAYLFNNMLEEQRNPNQQLQTIRHSDGVRELSLLRNDFGHYVASGSINNHEVTFMLDTGATGVAIPAKIARDIGLQRGPAIEMVTANGRATGYMSKLDRIGIDGIELENISAVINPNDDSEMILLGMSFLKEIEFTQRGDELILRQH